MQELVEELLKLDTLVNDKNIKKDYNHQNSKIILEKVRNFFQKLNIVVPEWISDRPRKQEQVKNGIIEVFYIEKNKKPIYAACNGADDLESILNLFDERLNNLLNRLDNWLSSNPDLDDESKTSLENYSNAVYKCVKVYGTQRKKRAAKFKELSTVDEIKEELQHFFAEIILNYIIIVLFDALYERLNNSVGQIYQQIIKEINEFLKENGIYTKLVLVGDQIDPECMEPTPDSANNITDDYQKFDTIEEIRRYPYMFSDDLKIVDGYVKIWRRND